MKFDPKKSVSIHNPWPAEKYPIKKRTDVVYYDKARDVFGTGRITWYHPARQRDASCIISAGRPFYKIRPHDSNGPLDDLLIMAEHVQRDSKKGYKALFATILKESEEALAEFERRTKATRDDFESRIRTLKHTLTKI